jgi:hypothetical protein
LFVAFAVLCVGLVVIRGVRHYSMGLLVLIPVYEVMVTLVFPGDKPEIMTIFQEPLFVVVSILLVSLCLEKSSLGRIYLVLLAILAISVIGVVGELLGHDMTALLPFTMPDEAYFDKITTDSSGAERIRGFFPESGVLGAVVAGIGLVNSLAGGILAIGRQTRKVGICVLAFSVIAVALVLGSTLTKSGFTVLLCGAMGGILVLAFSRNNRCRLWAFGGAIAISIAIASVVLFAPEEIRGYFADEFDNDMEVIANPHAVKAANTGFATRMECWNLSVEAIADYPLGVGMYGLDSVLTKTGTSDLTHELRFFFNRDIFGLKNALANLIAQTGWVGLGLFLCWLFWNLIRPAWKWSRMSDGRSVAIGALYMASALVGLALMASCELYPVLAFFLLLKCHADSVANSIPSWISSDVSAFGPAIPPIDRRLTPFGNIG